MLQKCLHKWIYTWYMSWFLDWKNLLAHCLAVALLQLTLERASDKPTEKFQRAWYLGTMRISFDVGSVVEHYHCDSYQLQVGLINEFQVCIDHYPKENSIFVEVTSEKEKFSSAYWYYMMEKTSEWGTKLLVTFLIY